MSTQQEEEKLIEQLKQWCLKKLRENSFKKHWKELQISKLFDYAEAESREVVDAIFDKKSPEEVWREIGDVCNFFAMIGENYETQYNIDIKND